jgi:hypothetical protein
VSNGPAKNVDASKMLANGGIKRALKKIEL